jgi:hypothetical protein
VAHYIPLLRLHHSLTSLECYHCKHRKRPPKTERVFAPYLTLCGGRRTCLYCRRILRNLKFVELSSLISLRSQPDCSLPPTKYLILLQTIPRSDTCDSLIVKSDSFSRHTLVPGLSVKRNPCRTFTKKESRMLRGSRKSTQVMYHPFVLESRESDISSVGFFPETDKEVLLRYFSAISFPYLSSSKTTLEQGVLCTECCWKMAYDEHGWNNTQRLRRNASQDPVASTNRRNNLNHSRKRAFRQYIVSDIAIEDARKTISG